jgi:hypothetical protein
MAQPKPLAPTARHDAMNREHAMSQLAIDRPNATHVVLPGAELRERLAAVLNKARLSVRVPTSKMRPSSPTGVETIASMAPVDGRFRGFAGDLS